MRTPTPTPLRLSIQGVSRLSRTKYTLSPPPTIDKRLIRFYRERRTVHKTLQAQYQEGIQASLALAKLHMNDMLRLSPRHRKLVSGAALLAGNLFNSTSSPQDSPLKGRGEPRFRSTQLKRSRSKTSPAKATHATEAKSATEEFTRITSETSTARSNNERDSPSSSFHHPLSPSNNADHSDDGALGSCCKQLTPETLEYPPRDVPYPARDGAALRPRIFVRRPSPTFPPQLAVLAELTPVRWQVSALSSCPPSQL
jgi:hypothetical protein